MERNPPIPQGGEPDPGEDLLHHGLEQVAEQMQMIRNSGAERQENEQATLEYLRAVLADETGEVHSYAERAAVFTLLVSEERLKGAQDIVDKGNQLLDVEGKAYGSHGLEAMHAYGKDDMHRAERAFSRWAQPLEQQAHFFPEAFKDNHARDQVFATAIHNVLHRQPIEYADTEMEDYFKDESMAAVADYLVETALSGADLAKLLDGKGVQVDAAYGILRDLSDYMIDISRKLENHADVFLDLPLNVMAIKYALIKDTHHVSDCIHEDLQEYAAEFGEQTSDEE